MFKACRTLATRGDVIDISSRIIIGAASGKINTSPDQ